MNAKIEGLQIPAGATVDIHIHVTAPVNITPFVARQKVNVFVKMEISTQCGAQEPNLLVGERLCWSVPVRLSFPDRGTVGIVGEILVDVTTGELLVNDETVRRMTDNAIRLAERAAL